MAQITLKGTAIETIGNLPAKGAAAPAFTLVKSDLSEASLAGYKGKNWNVKLCVTTSTKNT